MESMTGYAFYEKSCSQFTFSIDLKSLNNKYLEAYVNLPKILKQRENDIQKKLKEAFSRGKLELTIEIYDWVDTSPVSINREAIKKYYGDLKKIHQSLKIELPLGLESVLALGGVSNRERTRITKTSQREIDRGISMVIRKAREMRLAEGSAIRKDVLHSIAEIERNAAVVKKLAAGIVEGKQEMLRKRLESAAGKTLDEPRIYTEIAILADKLDINEELVRLGDHTRKFRELAGAGGQSGRQLDFLSQEIFREVNTIASKANSSEISHIVVGMKNNIDKIREHCRNII